MIMLRLHSGRQNYFGMYNGLVRVLFIIEAGGAVTAVLTYGDIGSLY